MSDLKERRLKSLDYQIQELENRPNYYKKYWLRIIVIGVLVTLIAPEYTAKNAKNLIYYFDYNYPIITNNEITVIESLSLDNNNQYNETINLYPNPVKDNLNFNLPIGVNVLSFEVFDLIGKKIDSNTLQTNFINVKHYVNGIYILHLKTDKGVLIKKFIKN